MTPIDPVPTVRPAMVTDLYELTMAAAYWRGGMNQRASFELSVRRLPTERRFLVAAGLDAALDGLVDFTYLPEELEYLDGLGLFPDGFVDSLADLRFAGDVWAIPEGEVVFGSEPLVRVTAPLIEAQLVETYLLNQIASNTMQASKAARVAIATGDHAFVDFSARRDHGISAAMSAARAAWIGGSSGTSLVAAGQQWGIPLSGTMAHSFVMAFDDERDAFRAYARTFPDSAVLLLDTYDTVAGAHHAVEVAAELRHEGIELAGVRLDSGDLAALSIAVRRILDDGGLAQARILASGDLDEYRVAELESAGARIDAYGVGTQLGTSADAPSLGAVYKLVEDDDGPKMKLAESKQTWPGRKQVWRCPDRDVVGLHDEDVTDGRPLLVEVMRTGQRLAAGNEALDTARERCAAGVAALPDRVRSLEPATTDADRWPVEHSPGLLDLADQVRHDLLEVGS